MERLKVSNSQIRTNTKELAKSILKFYEPYAYFRVDVIHSYPNI